MDIQLDEAAIRSLARHEPVSKAVVDRAEQGADYARSIAPVRTGRYRDSIEVVEDDDGADIVADVDYADDLEYGTRHMEGQHIFGRTLDSLRSSGQP
ncbi:HK97 gp10 family phage protein [Streptomyces sp. NPDC049952]|uniref:HK97 gp10 family phage protein n=1 Tax=Streptomyces sp. NPDC049952 TaxID=3156665 RepID=UPI00342BA8B3